MSIFRDAIAAYSKAASERASVVREYVKAISLFPSRYSPEIVKVTPPEDAVAAYGWNPWLYAAVRTIGDAVAQIPRVVYREASDGGLDPMPGDAQDLLDKPNTFQTGDAFRRAIVSWLVLDGNAYILKLYGDEVGSDEVFATEKPNGPPEQLMILHPRTITAEADRYTRVSRYEYSPNQNTKIYIHPSRLLHIAEFSIEGYTSGTGAGEVLGTTLALAKWTQQWNINGFKHGGSHQRLVASFKGQLLKDESLKRRIEYQLKRKVGKGSHEPLIGDNEVDWKMLGSTMRDMEFTELWKFVIMETAAAIGVPPGKLGFLEFANYSNMDVQERGFWVDTARPKLCLIDSFFTEFLMPEFGDNLIVASDFSGVAALQDDLSEAADIAVKVGNILTVNQLRAYMAERGLKEAEGDLPGGDVTLAEYRSQIHARALFGADPSGLGEDDNAASDETRRSAPVHTKAVDARDATRLDHARRVDRYTADIKRDLDGILRGWQAHALKALDRASKATTATRTKVFTVADLEIYEVVPNATEAQRLVARQSRIFQTRTLMQRAAEVLAELGIDASVDLTQANVRAYLSSKVQAISGNWPETVLTRLRETLIETVTSSEDLTISALQDAVKNVMDVEHARALAIARTEAVPAFNFGSVAAYEASGVVERMEWLDAGDSEVRDSHRNVEPVVLGQPFAVGGSLLRYPGDPEGPPEEIINCRCTVVPVVTAEEAAHVGVAKGASGRAV